MSLLDSNCSQCMGWKWDTGRWCRSQLSLVPSLCWRRFDSPIDRKRRRREAQWPRPPPRHPEEWSDLCECPSCRRSLLPPARCTLAAPVLSPAEIEEFCIEEAGRVSIGVRFSAKTTDVLIEMSRKIFVTSYGGFNPLLMITLGHLRPSLSPF